MKKILLHIVILNVLIASTAFSQKKSILSRAFHSQITSGHVQDFLEELNHNSGLVIEYSSNTVDMQKVVNLDGSEKTVGSLLKKILTGQHVKLLIKNNKLILVKSAAIINTDELVPAYTFFGFVKAENSEEPMIGATVYEPSTGKGIATNSYGYFSLSLPQGKHHVEVSYVGYNARFLDITLKQNTRADIALTLQHDEAIMQEIVLPITGYVKRNGADRIHANQNGSYNHLMGENDPVRSAYLLPGVKNIPESFNGMFVRGGSSGENLFLMDGNVVYNPTHMLGALSIVNETSVKSMSLYKSDFPSKYGGATSSVIDIYTKEGNMKEWRGKAFAGTLAGSFTLEGPVVKNKTAAMASFRHSWLTPLFSLFQNGIKPNFYDIHFKATQVINKNNKVMINFYNGGDEVKQSDEELDILHKWGNTIASLSWNRVIGSRSFVNTSVNMSRYKNLGGFKYSFYDDDLDDDDDDGDLKEKLDSGSVGTFSTTEQYNLKSQAEIYMNDNVKLNIGVKITHNIIRPFDTKFSEEIDDDEEDFTSFDPLPFDELSGYGEMEIKINKRLFVRPGLHFSAYHFQDYYFYSLQPRFFTSYQLAKRQQLFASYSRMTQYLHLVTNPYLGMNADLWTPSTNKLQPEESDSYNLGYSYNRNVKLKVSLEGYYKDLHNVTNYAEGRSFFVNNKNWEQNITTGKGRAYGAELMIQRSSDKFSFLASYTLAWSWRQFEDVNNGKKIPFKYDRRHSLNLGMDYKFNKNFDVTSLWTFSTGDAFSLPDYMYPDFDNAQQITNPGDIFKDYRFVYHFAQNNQYRTSPYHRLDGALNYQTDKNKKSSLKLTLGVYNIYGSPDQYMYQIKGSTKDKSLIVGKSMKLFDMTPYLSATFKF